MLLMASKIFIHWIMLMSGKNSRLDFHKIVQVRQIEFATALVA